MTWPFMRMRYARCECLDYLIVFSEANLRLSACVTYYKSGVVLLLG